MDGSCRATTLLFAGPWWREYFLGLQKKHDHVRGRGSAGPPNIPIQSAYVRGFQSLPPSMLCQGRSVCLPYLLKAQPLDSCARNMNCLRVPLSGAKPKPQDRTLVSINLPRAVSIFHGGPRLSRFLLVQMSQVLFSEDGYFLLVALFRLLHCT